MMRALLLCLLLGAPLAQADTYKWVDANGVVNYSNAPPPGAAKGMTPQTVPDRISSYSVEPVVANPIEVYRRQDLDHQEWMQRQQLMAMQAAAAPAPADDYYTPAYYYPTYGARSRGMFRPAVFNAVRAIAPHPAPRASLRRF